MMKVLFVCLGNICRSPLAEAIFNKRIEELGLQHQFVADSCGTNSYHTGELADPRTRSVARKFGVEISHRARTFSKSDFSSFDRIFVMEEANFKTLIKLDTEGEYASKIEFLRNYDLKAAKSTTVPDPYYGTEQDFIEVHQILERCIEGLIVGLQKEI
ncbi:low molecular weight protein-tyrosine-phosphatase [Bacteroidota bacterium]